LLSVFVSALPKREIHGYYTDWSSLAPENIPSSKLTHICYAFAEVEQDASLSGYTDSILSKVVQNAHSNNVKVLITVGGWTGGRWISSLLLNSSSRSKLISNIVNLYKQFKLDGVILDWEFPNDVDGMQCNTRNKLDSANLLHFFTELRSKLGNSAVISAATALTPFNGPNGLPLTDVRPFAKVVDSIQLMAYDIMGSWSQTTGSNAPLYTAKGAPDTLSGDAGVKAWTKAGFPANKIRLGVPFYGIAETVKSDMNQAGSQFVKFVLPQRKGDSSDSLSADPCPGAKKSFSGEYQYSSMIQNKILTSPLISNSAQGWTRHFDTHTQTPWVFSPKENMFITYDDPQSLAAKVKYAMSKGLGGMMIWSIDMDSNGDLLDALQPIRN